MKKTEKEKFVAELHSRLQNTAGTFLVDYQGLNVDAMNKLRNELRKAGAEFQVVKNRLLKLASRETPSEVIQSDMTGPSGITLASDDVVAPAKVLVDFAKEFSHLKIKSGQISGKASGPDGIKKLAELPGRDVLLAQTLSAMQAVPASFVRVLNGVTVKFINVLRAIEQQKAS
ncbi:MAG: 50S ribosomal protein L10 [Desulfatiglandaceae bacterium]